MNINKNKTQLNITRGNDITLVVTLNRDGDHFPTHLAEDVKVSILSRLGYRQNLAFQLDVDKLVVDIPAKVIMTNVYGLLIEGTLGGSQWRTFYESLLRYTDFTEALVTDTVQQTGDSFDLTLEVQLYKGLNEAIIEEVQQAVSDVHEAIGELDNKVAEHNEDETAHASLFAAMRKSIEDGMCVAISWSDLKALRDNGELLPGRFYRITDYVTTTSQADTQSAGHQFDIVIMATTGSTLSESAVAVLHDGDTYFQNARLEAWELKYSLDNDANRFAWADPVNGKGVIYLMKDEYANELPYDFKNIMFKRCYCECDAFEGEGRYVALPGVTVGPDEDFLPAQDDNNFIYVYTFSCLASLDEDPSDQPAQADASMGFFQTENQMSADYGDSPRPANNIFEPYFITQSIDDEPLRRVRALPNITFQQFFTDEFSCRCLDNHIGSSCHDISCRIKYFFNNDFAKSSTENCYFIGYIDHNHFSGNIIECTFSGQVQYSTFSGDVQYCTFSGEIKQCTFSGEVGRCTFSGWVQNCTFSGSLTWCTFSGQVENCTFSGDVYNCTFSGSVSYCTFSGYCFNNTFSGSLGWCTFSGSLGRCTFSGNVGDCTFSGWLRYSTFSGDIAYSRFIGYTYYCDFVYTGTLQHVTVCGRIEGTQSNRKQAKPAGGVPYDQVVTVDEDGTVVVREPYL